MGKNQIEGQIRLARSGTGFLDFPDKEKGSVRIPNRDLNTALDKDTVRVTLEKDSQGRKSGKVLKVIRRFRNKFVGTVDKEDNKYFVIPDDNKFYLDIFIPKSFAKNIKPKQKVQVEITKWANLDKNPEGKILKVIGEKGEHETEMQSILLEKGIDLKFPSEVEKVVVEVEARVISAEESSDLTVIRKILSEIRSLAKNLIKTRHSSSGDLKSERRAIGDLRVKVARDTKSIKNLEEKEGDFGEKIKKLRKSINEEVESQIGAEKQTFKILSEQSEVKIRLNELKNLEEKINKEERNFKAEITEAATLVGREVLDYKEFSVKDGRGSYLTSEEMAEENREKQEKRLKEIERIKIRLEDAGGASGEEIMKEYEEVSERDQFLEKEIEDLKESAGALQGLIKELEEKLEAEFREGIGKINNQFQEFFSLMFGGGSASLSVVKIEKRLSKEEDEIEIPEEEEIEESGADGVEINVSLPRKKIKGLMALSGGERALTSIALLFAMSQVKPPPFIILDETDAALDEANSRKYGDMIKNLSEDSQLILITHNRETMSRAGVLYGVTMGADSVSKLLSVDLEEAVEVAK